jgi:hypothetical protein
MPPVLRELDLLGPGFPEPLGHPLGRLSLTIGAGPALDRREPLDETLQPLYVGGLIHRDPEGTTALVSPVPGAASMIFIT